MRRLPQPRELVRRGLDAGERVTAEALDALLRHRTVIEPAGAVLTRLTRAKRLYDGAVARGWGLLGLPSRRDQERMLHALNEIESKLLDLEERLDAREAPRR